MKSPLDNKQYVCAVLIDLQKTFDPVHHIILLDKLPHHWIREISICFLYNLGIEINFVTINGFYSDLQNVWHRVPLSMPPPLSAIHQWFHNVITFFFPFHFTDVIHVSNKQNSVDNVNKTLNKQQRLNKRTLFLAECNKNWDHSF